jgi:hypothetical protein
MTKVKNLRLKTSLIGEIVPNKTDGEAGRYVEDLLESAGIQINRTSTVDNPLFEVKTRDLDSTSPQTVGGMTLKKIKQTAWKDSPVFEKIQQQYRVKTQNNIVVANDMYDFSGWAVQSLLEEAYEAGRTDIINGNSNDYIYGSKYGYFERTNKKSKTWCFRINHKAMQTLEAIAHSNFNELFEAV